MLLNKVIDSYETLHYEIARMKIDAHLSFSKREALGIRLPSMRRSKSFKKQKNDDLSQSHCQHLGKIHGKKHLSTTNYNFKTKIRIFHQNHGLSLKRYQFKTSSTSSFRAYNGVFFLFARQYRQEKCVLRYSRRKNVSLSCKNNKLKKSKN